MSLSGYVAFEIIRRQPQRLARLVLMVTTAVADHPARKAGRLSDIATLREGGIEALIPELLSRWLWPAHALEPEPVNLMDDMARSVSARSQLNQQTAMLARLDSHDELDTVTVPTLVVCGRQDPVTPLADHVAIAARVAGSRLRVIEDCGHLATIEQPLAVNQVLAEWLHDTATPE